ncbi:hypothetical protein WR25_19381 [Diploscapter pachys]|uniref:SPIN90/Ldb17 leucine-rich domain-containing protein n=1 Tax=Diploscapter pachys TaxID=2018661 RepID=A0A2A2KEU0_9BILA|nr:hypothetical protein WR25_19381 [Diploscapter pachys]
MGLLKELKRAGEMSQDTTEIVVLLIRKLASNSPSQIQAIYEAGLIDFLVDNIDFIAIFGEKKLPASFILLRILNKANNKGEILLSILHYESLMTLIDKLNSTEDRSVVDDIVMIIQICLDHAEKENTILHQKAMEILTMHVNVEKLNEDTDSEQKDEL